MITVSNDGPVAAGASEAAVEATAGATAGATATQQGRGFGVMGMRERARSIGGDLCAGHRPEGGFEVTTALPLQPYGAEGSPAST